MLTGVVALLLAVGGAALPAAPAAAAPGVSGPPQPDVGSGSGIAITMTTQNDGRPVSITDEKHPGWAHPELGALQEVLVTVQLNGTPVHQWVSHLETPDAFQGITPEDCRGDEEAPPKQISCVYRVQTVEGLNTLGFVFTGDGGRVMGYAVGFLMGGSLGWSAGWEVLDATGQWSAVSHDSAVELPATLSSALRYVVTNDGGIPFRIDDACSDRILAPRTQLRCPVSGVRPAQSLAGDYQEELHLHDVVGRQAQIDIKTTVRAGQADATLAPRVDAAAPAWPWLLLLLVPIAGFFVLLKFRALRRAASREPPAPHPYQGASPATPEPAAVRRR